jgi:Uma2 family endonuclease
MPVNEKTFRQLALEDPESHWELVCGQLRRKPGMSADHNRIGIELTVSLRNQLDRASYQVRYNAGHLRRTSGSYYIPDVMVIPAELEAPFRGVNRLEFYRDPLPLVAEVWSPSTGDYDVDEKIPEYRRRGDLEIWRMHPYERTLRAWIRQSDGSYSERLYTSGMVQPSALPGVSIDLDELFTL